MVDNIAITPGSGATIATDEVGGFHHQRIKNTWGADGVINDVDVATGKPMPVQLRSPTGVDLTAAAGTPSAAVITIQGAAGATGIGVPVNNPGTFATQETGGALTALQLIDDMIIAQNQPISTTKQSLIGGSVTTAAPTYATGNVSPLSLTTAGSLRVEVASTQLSSLWTGAQAMAAGFQLIDVPTNGTAARAAQLPTALGTAGGIRTDDIFATYKTVAQSQTDFLLGVTGAVNDYLAGVLIVPSTTAAGIVSIKDGNGGSMSIFAGAVTTALTDLKPFMVPLGLYCILSTTAGWRVSTGANVTAIAIGKFT